MRDTWLNYLTDKFARLPEEINVFELGFEDEIFLQELILLQCPELEEDEVFQTIQTCAMEQNDVRELMVDVSRRMIA